jgi:hypothetical protein
MEQEYWKLAIKAGADWKDSSGRIKLPSEVINSGPAWDKIKKPLIIQKISYHKGSPEIIKRLYRLFGKSPNEPYIDSATVGIDQELKYSKVNFLLRSSSDFSPFGSDTDWADFRELRSKLDNLPPNSPIRLGNDFYVVQLGTEVRVYSKERFPVELAVARSQIDEYVYFEEHRVGILDIPVNSLHARSARR